MQTYLLFDEIKFVCKVINIIIITIDISYKFFLSLSEYLNEDIRPAKLSGITTIQITLQIHQFALKACNFK